MILHVSPHAPALVSAAAATLLFLHVGGASAGLVSGPVAMLAAKGGRLHRAAGNVFFVSMLIMSGARPWRRSCRGTRFPTPWPDCSPSTWWRRPG